MFLESIRQNKIPTKRGYVLNNTKPIKLNKLGGISEDLLTELLGVEVRQLIADAVEVDFDFLKYIHNASSVVEPCFTP